MMDTYLDLLHWFISFWIKTLLILWGLPLYVKLCQSNNQQNNHVNQSLQIREHKVCSSFKDNIWGADLTGMQSISKYNNRFRFLLCVIDIFKKYARVIPLKDKKGITITNAF